MRKISYTVPPALDGSSVAAVLRSHGFSTALLRSLKKTYGPCAGMIARCAPLTRCIPATLLP
ncbi:MAG: hypothetical protein ACLTKQ_01390 [Acutalibacteraceae bacterium]|nr:hypothetical protein [Acutalibacteraceae bacterium]HJI89070.1 hypothetical protein [Oscillospiraceae bacterium]